MSKLSIKATLGKSGSQVPPVIFGTSALGNLYQALPYEDKLEILRNFFEYIEAPVVLDSAGKYGAGLALEIIGKGMRELGIAPQDVLISNKLGWYRVPLTGSEPTFEPGAWAELENDAEQRISYEGIIECWQQGNELLGEGYDAQIVSVHDPDEYLAQARSDEDRKVRFDNVVGAYKALIELKQQDKVQSVGIGSKDWQVIQEIADVVELDWVMLAVSLTIMNHPQELLEFVEDLRQRGIGVINSAVFQAGFLTGGKYYDYRIPDENDSEDKKLFEWRYKFFSICEQFDVAPAAACVQFGIIPEGIVSVALNTSNPKRVKQNVELVTVEIPDAFWSAMQDAGMINNSIQFINAASR